MAETDYTLHALIALAERLVDIPAPGAHGAYVDGLGSEGSALQQAMLHPDQALKTLPRSPVQAVAFALHLVLARVPTVPGTCDHVVAEDYGLAYSGFATARIHWESIPSAYKHSVGEPVLPGGGVFFEHVGGSDASDAGHATIGVGGTNIASTDIVTNGRVSVVPISLIVARWGLRYVGWSDPWYGAQGVDVLVKPVPLPPHHPPTPPAYLEDETMTTLYQHQIPGHVNAEFAVSIDPVKQMPVVGWVKDPATRDALVAAGALTAVPAKPLPTALVPFISGTLPPTTP